MDITFKGFKNVGAERVSLHELTGRKSVATILNCELTNDFNGKDLDAFDKVLKKYNNKFNQHFLHLGLYQHFKYPDSNLSEDIFVVNYEDFPINTENLGVLENIVNLLKKIVQTPAKEFKVNKDYLESDDFYGSYLFIDKSTDKETINSIHRPKNVKNTANFLIEKITEAVEEALS